jgi:hypothetical protein
MQEPAMTALQQPMTDRMPADRQRLALEGFFGIMQRWGVDNGTARRILGSPPERTFFACLEVLYSDPALADGWVKRPNAQFGGATPLERMAAGDVTDLAAVRAYLDAARAPWS